MITNSGKEKIAEFLNGLLGEMVVTIDGADEVLPFTVQELDDDRVKVGATLDETYAGEVSNVRLMDTDSEIFAERAENIDKPAGKVLPLSFTYTVTEEAL